MNREQTARVVKVMQHHADGGDVQYRCKGSKVWGDVMNGDPSWDWSCYQYRIKPTIVTVRRWAHLNQGCRLINIYEQCAAASDAADRNGGFVVELTGSYETPRE